VNHRNSNHNTACALITGDQQALTTPKLAYSLAHCSQTEHSLATVIHSLKYKSIQQGISSEIHTGLKLRTEPVHRIYTPTHSCMAAEGLIMPPTLLCTSYARLHTIKHTNCCTETDDSLHSSVVSPVGLCTIQQTSTTAQQLMTASTLQYSVPWGCKPYSRHQLLHTN
jgi:hypothetical protein